MLMDVLKLFWGVVIAGAFLYFIISFAKGAARSEGIKYNWLAVGLAFLIVGSALYMVFFVQP